MSAPSKREVVQQALHVTGWMLQAIEAPRDLQYWPRRDREAWFDVIGRPRLREVMAGLQAQGEAPAWAHVEPHDAFQTTITISPDQTLVSDR